MSSNKLTTHIEGGSFFHKERKIVMQITFQGRLAENTPNLILEVNQFIIELQAWIQETSNMPIEIKGI